MLISFLSEVLRRFSEVELGDFFFRAMYSHSIPPTDLLAALRLASASGDAVAGRTAAHGTTSTGSSPAGAGASGSGEQGQDLSKAGGGGGLIDHADRLTDMLTRAPGTPAEAISVGTARAVPVHRLIMPHIDSDREVFAKEGREGGGGLDVFPRLAALRTALGPFGAPAASASAATSASDSVRGTSTYSLQAGTAVVDGLLGAYYASGDGGTFVNRLIDAALPWGDDLGTRGVTECLPLLASSREQAPDDVVKGMGSGDPAAGEAAVRFAVGRVAAQAILGLAAQDEGAAGVLLGRVAALAPIVGGEARLGMGTGSLTREERRSLELLPALGMLLARGRLSGRSPTDRDVAGIGGSLEIELRETVVKAAADAEVETGGRQ